MYTGPRVRMVLLRGDFSKLQGDIPEQQVVLHEGKIKKHYQAHHTPGVEFLPPEDTEVLTTCYPALLPERWRKIHIFPDCTKKVWGKIVDWEEVVLSPGFSLYCPVVEYRHN